MANNHCQNRGDSTGLKEFVDVDSGVQIPSGTTAQRDQQLQLVK